MKIHILRGSSISIADYLATLDKYQRRYLSGRCCALCDAPLDHPTCGTVYPGTDFECTKDQMIARLESCLSEYKPRYGARK